MAIARPVHARNG